MFAQGLAIQLCPCTSLNPSTLLAHDLSTHLTPFLSKISHECNSFLCFDVQLQPLFRNNHRVEGHRMDGLKLVTRSQKRKWIKIEVEESEANALSNCHRYFMKIGFNLDGMKTGLAFCYKIKAIFQKSLLIKVDPS